MFYNLLLTLKISGLVVIIPTNRCHWLRVYVIFRNFSTRFSKLSTPFWKTICILYNPKEIFFYKQPAKAGRMSGSSHTTQINEQATRSASLPRRWCTNHGPVHDVLAQRTSRLDYALFVKGTFNWIIINCPRNANIVLKF